MTRYLVVAHQTAVSPELLDRVSQLARDDPEAMFTILVPATVVDHLLIWKEGESRDIAQRSGEKAAELFKTNGLNVPSVNVGDSSPLLAIEDHLRAHPENYDAIVLSTLPEGLSRWLRQDVHSRAERQFALPIIHVVARKESGVASSSEG